MNRKIPCNCKSCTNKRLKWKERKLKMTPEQVQKEKEYKHQYYLKNIDRLKTNIQKNNQLRKGPLLTPEQRSLIAINSNFHRNKVRRS